MKHSINANLIIFLMALTTQSLTYASEILRLNSFPAQAEVYIQRSNSKELLGTTPLQIELKMAQGGTLLLAKPGYIQVQLPISKSLPLDETDLTINLEGLNEKDFTLSL